MTITMHMLFYLLLCIIPCHSSTLLFSPTFNEPDHPKAAYDSYPFQNHTLPWDTRLTDLVQRLELPEIPPQMMAIYKKPCPAIERLGIKKYNWITECLSGHANVHATSFPQALGMAASWSTNLTYQIAEATANEVRAHYNTLSSAKTFYGLTCFSPVINIMRHPLWGRNQETYGEDPYLTGRLAQHYVHGLQGSHPRYVRVAAGCKHFDVHGGPENIPVSRFSFDAKVSTRDWRMTFLPAFKMCVEAGTYSMMCSYNSVNGVPSCVNHDLLTSIPRDEWDYRGYVISDNHALPQVKLGHHYAHNYTEVATLAVRAGCNLELAQSVTTFTKIPQAIAMGKLTEDEVRNNVKPLMYTRLRLGEFDPPELNPYTKIPMSVVQSKEHRALAIKAAVMSFVLLKNDNNTLPLKTPLSSAAIVGPFGDNLKALYGDYSAIINATYAKTPLAGLKQIAHSVRNASGCDNVHCKKYNQGTIKTAVKGADVIIVCLGLGNAQETEGNDRKTLDLPGKQLQLLQDVISYGSGRPVILLLFNAGPLDVGFAQNSPHVHSILACFYPAQATGQALYNVITGKYSPAGRLTATWPLTLDQVPPITNYSMEGHTYRYYSGDPLYPFGYGLSYSSFTYSHLSISPSRVAAGSNVIVSVDVTNHGNMEADEVVQVYISWVCSPVPTPKLQLVAFNRASIADQQTVTLIIDAEQMAVWLDDDTGFSIPKGKYEVFVGGQQPNQKTKVPSNVLSGSFTVI